MEKRISLNAAQMWHLLWLDRYENGAKGQRFNYGPATKKLEKLGLVTVEVLDIKYPKDVLVTLTENGLSAAKQLREQGFNVRNTA